MRSRPLGPLSAALLAVGLGLLACAVGTRMLAEYDLPWHLAFGRQIVRSRAIPRVDPFAYTHTKVRYVGALADTLLYALHVLGGELALQLLAALIALLLGMILYARTKRGGPFGVVVSSFGLIAASPWLFARPATITFLFTAVTLALIDVHRESSNPAKGRRALVLATAVVPLWANVHGGAVVAIGALLLNALDHALTKSVSPAALPSFESFRRDAVVAAATAPVLALLNPAGVHYFAGIADVGTYSDLLGEWARTGTEFFFHTSPAAGAFLVFALAALVLGLERSRSRVPPLYDGALALAAFALASRVRFVPVSIVILVPLVARRTSQVMRDVPSMQRVAALSSCLVGPAAFELDATTHGVGWDPLHFPDAAVSFVERAKPHGHMWNAWPYGGYLIWRLFPDYEVLIDGRIGFVHDEALVRRVVASEQDERAFSSLAEEFQIEWAFCEAREARPSCIPLARRSDWTLVFWDDIAAVYVRSAGANPELASRGYRLLGHLSPPELPLARALTEDGRGDVAHDGALARQQAPASPRAVFLDAAGALAAGDHPRFLEAVSDLSRLVPDHAALPLLREAERVRFPAGK